jgi:hypothetical protein
MPGPIDLDDDVGATASSGQEILVDVHGPVTVDRDPVVPHAKRRTGDDLRQLALGRDRFESSDADSSDGTVVDGDDGPVEAAISFGCEPISG